MDNFLNNFEQIVNTLKGNNISTDHLLIFDTEEGWTYNGEKNWKAFTVGNNNLVNIEFNEDPKTFQMSGQLDLGQYRVYVLEEFDE